MRFSAPGKVKTSAELSADLVSPAGAGFFVYCGGLKAMLDSSALHDAIGGWFCLAVFGNGHAS